VVSILQSKFEAPYQEPQNYSPKLLPLDFVDLPSKERNPGLVCREFISLQQLLAACKANQTTLQAAIVAAVSIAQVEAIVNKSTPAKWPITLYVNTPIDLRGFLPSGTCDFYNAISNLIAVHSIGANISSPNYSTESFWEISRLDYIC
jgi:hypothetical protein